MQSTIFAKTFILDVLLGSEYVSDYCLWIRQFFLLFFQFESKKFRSSRSQMSFKIDVFNNFAIFTEKQLCWSLFVVKLLSCKPENALKRDSNTSVFLSTLLNF